MTVTAAVLVRNFKRPVAKSASIRQHDQNAIRKHEVGLGKQNLAMRRSLITPEARWYRADR